MRGINSLSPPLFNKAKSHNHREVINYITPNSIKFTSLFSLLSSDSKHSTRGGSQPREREFSSKVISYAINPVPTIKSDEGRQGVNFHENLKNSQRDLTRLQMYNTIDLESEVTNG